MKKTILFILFLLLIGSGPSRIHAQIASASDNLTAQPITNRTVPFNLSNEGVSKPIIWGFDLAWRDENNLRRGIAFSDTSLIGIIRSSFTPTAPIVDGKLGQQELDWLKYRINALKMVNRNRTKILLNCDLPWIDEWFYPLDEELFDRTPFINNPEIRKTRAERWAELIDITTKAHEDAGYTVVSVAPFNEADYIYNLQCTKPLFNDVVLELMKNPRFDNIRISAGNTLNADPAWEWYDYMKRNSRADEGNTHQLAGYFPQYADFFTKVRANGDHATNDELHNVMEAMVGVEYGMQTGIWWGTAEYCRGAFMKASEGTRLAYSEHRDNWTSASVYRHPEGNVQAFVGASERQATTTSYRFVSKEKDVYFDGHGPQREFVIEIPGGNGYGVNQPGAEKVVNITWGEDIQPVINGRYVLVNRKSKKVMEVAYGGANAGSNVQQNSYKNAAYQQWNVTPVDSRIGGDFSYFTFTAAHSGKILDLLNFSLNNGGNIQVWDIGKNTETGKDLIGGNQQWYLEYAEDGWFYIRSRHSAKCIEVANGSTSVGANIQQKDKNNGTNQQWRFLPVGVPIEFTAPDPPVGLVATANATSIRLDWSANSEEDIAGYTIFRAESVEGPYNTIARNVKSTSFVDNTVTAGKEYFYAIKAVDNSMNRSEYSNKISSTATGAKELIACYSFEENTLDNTIHLNHSAPYQGITYSIGQVGSKSLELNGKDAFVQLPTTLANHKNITIATWVYWKGSDAWQRIFDFGNGENENMFLTPRSDSGRLCFTIKNEGKEQRLNSSVSSLSLKKWSHVAVTLDESGTRLYFNGKLVAESNDMTVSPIDFKPVLNYIGRSQYTTDPLFKGNIDDFRIYNHALSANEISKIYEMLPNNLENIESADEEGLSLWPLPAGDILYINYSTENTNSSSSISIFDINGSLILDKTIKNNTNTELNLSSFAPGTYLLKLTNGKELLTRKFFITH